jgi:hypothetical protein
MEKQQKLEKKSIFTNRFDPEIDIQYWLSLKRFFKVIGSS